MDQSRALADWQLPDGVDRSLLSYLTNDNLAAEYDEALAESPLINNDCHFVQQHSRPGGIFVDLGCGTGRLLAHLVPHQQILVGVDLSLPMLHQAQKKLSDHLDRVALLKANLVHLDSLRSDRFDSAACLFSTLGMIRGSKNRQSFLRHVFRILKPGGIFCLHVHNRWWNLWNHVDRRWLILDLWRSLRFSKNVGDRTMPPHQGHAGFTLHLFTMSEIQRLLSKCGFECLVCQPVSLRQDGKLSIPWLFPNLRCYGYLLALRKPAK